MKRTSLVLLSALCAAPLYADTGQHLIPAGSLIGCTISEPRLSSKNATVGDPVLCQLGHAERYGRSVLPYNSYLVGRFEDYKDPGHFAGKGWMELKFDRMVVEPDTVVPIDARVVDVPGYRVDSQGRILGKGHATRDTVMWMIPILWPIDLINLPRRGPRPTLKEETRLTLKVMDDLAIPNSTSPQSDPYGLMHRQPSAQNEPPPVQQPEPAPQTAYDEPAPQPAEPSAPAPYAYVAPPPPVVAYLPPPPMVAAYAPMVVVPVRPAYGYYGYAPRAYAYGYAPRVVAPRAYGYGGAGYYGGRAAYARAGMTRRGY